MGWLDNGQGPNFMVMGGLMEGKRTHLSDFKDNASISLINVYRLSKADLLLKLILRYVINVFLASCQVSSL